MEFLFLPRSLRNYPGGVSLATLAFFGHCVGGHTPNTHLNSMFYNILRNYFWIY